MQKRSHPYKLFKIDSLKVFLTTTVSHLIIFHFSTITLISNTIKHAYKIINITDTIKF